MTKQLRYRIMFTMMFLLSFTFISILVVINIWTRADSQAEADDNLRFLMQRELKPDFPPKPQDENPPAKISEDTFESQKPTNTWNSPPVPNEEDSKATDSGHLFSKKEEHPTPDMQRHREIAISHYILVNYTADKELISIENTLSDSLSDIEIEDYCNKILSDHKSHGTIEHLRYAVNPHNDGVAIAFIDHSATEENINNLLMISIVLGIIGLTAFAFLSYTISGLMVRPVEDAFQKQKQFISDASHELKTPIAVILSNSELLEDQIGENKQLSYIKKECDQMHHLVTSLLELTRLEQEPYTDVAKNTFSLTDALLECVLPFESIAFEKGILMQEDILPNLSFYGVKEQIQQVATILIDNALTHTEKGGEINITLQRTPHNIIFTVSNTGEPIPEEEQEQLFERFYRVDKARNRASGHYGLGLSIAKTILNNHKGRIHVECKNGITSFIVTLRLNENKK